MRYRRREASFMNASRNFIFYCHKTFIESTKSPIQPTYLSTTEAIKSLNRTLSKTNCPFLVVPAPVYIISFLIAIELLRQIFNICAQRHHLFGALCHYEGETCGQKCGAFPILISCMACAGLSRENSQVLANMWNGPERDQKPYHNLGF